MSILEAMAHGCLVFAIDAPGPSFLIRDGETGFLCKTVDDMARKLKDIAGSKGKTETILSEARAYIVYNLTWDNLVHNFLMFRDNT